jgi:hypothetical protein
MTSLLPLTVTCALLLAIATLASGCAPTRGVRIDEYVVTCPTRPSHCAEGAAKLCGGDYDVVGRKSDNQAGSMLVRCRVPAGK